MTNKRDRRQTPQGTSLAKGKSSIDKTIEDFWAEALPPDGRELKADTASVKSDDRITVNKSPLNGEGTDARVIPTLEIPKKKKNRSRARARNNYRVSVLNPDGTPAMPEPCPKGRGLLTRVKAVSVLDSKLLLTSTNSNVLSADCSRRSTPNEKTGLDESL